MDDFDRAVALHRDGRPAHAAGLCETILSREPAHARALHLLGAIRFTAGQRDTAIALLERAVAAKPDYGEAEYNLGVMLAETGRAEAAARHFGRAAALRPEHFEAHVRHGSLLMALGRFSEAETAFRRALSIQPDQALVLIDLASVLLNQHKIDAALDAGQRAVTLAPAIPEAHLRVGQALLRQRKKAEALARFERARELDPGSAIPLNWISSVYYEDQDLDTAEQVAQRAFALDPDSPIVLERLAAIARARGDAARAVELYSRAIEQAPDRLDIRRNHLVALLYQPNTSPSDRFAAYREFGRVAEGKAALRPLPPGRTSLDPDRRLRIGWISSDLRVHSVARNLELLFAERDRTRFEMYCYARVSKPDAVTDWFRSHADGWRSIVGMTDEAVARQIRDDAIDVMIYLAGLFDDNRPEIAAWRPAPIQVSLFDAATSGMDAMDYFIADAVTVPRPATEKFTERVLRLPSFLVQPPIEWATEATPPPCATAGHVTFGSFNNPAKLNDEVLALWGDVLRRVPDSRLRLRYRRNFGSPTLQARVRAAVGADVAGRVEFDAADVPMDHHMRTYETIDIALDPFPFNGSTTTFEALWMGAPVVALLGTTFMSRWTASMLHKIGADELVARTREEYIDIAARLAADPQRLATLRAGLRARVAASALCDGRRTARYVERALRAVWRRWCQGAGAGG